MAVIVVVWYVAQRQIETNKSGASGGGGGVHKTSRRSVRTSPPAVFFFFFTAAISDEGGGMVSRHYDTHLTPAWSTHPKERSKTHLCAPNGRAWSSNSHDRLTRVCWPRLLHLSTTKKEGTTMYLCRKNTQKNLPQPCSTPIRSVRAAATGVHTQDRSRPRSPAAGRP